MTKLVLQTRLFNLHAVFLLLFFSTIFSVQGQWKYPEFNKFTKDIIISYDVIYDRQLTNVEKSNPRFIKSISVVFKKGILIERIFYNNQTTISFYDYNNEKIYHCLKEAKFGIVNELENPKKEAKVNLNETKLILDYKCDKATVMIEGVPKSVYYTKKLGLRFCKNFDVDGFLLQYPGYINNKLGHFTVVAKKIFFDDINPSVYSIDDYDISTEEELEKSNSRYTESLNKNKLKHLGKESKKFSARTLKGKKISSKKNLGEVTVINFWFINCAPCRKEIPSLNKLKEKYHSENINFIAVALDNEIKLKTFLNKHNFNFDIIPNGRWLAQKFNVKSYPTSVVIDKNGIVQFYETGFRNKQIESMTDKIDVLLKE